VPTSWSARYPLTPKPSPFVDARWLKPGAFATLPDLALPWLRDSMSAFACIVIDDREQEATMPDPMVAPELVSGDLADLVDGSITGKSPGNGPPHSFFEASGSLILRLLLSRIGERVG
jgi:ornithine cyclodeaminase/alanine dehydrogenase-like protein (mu-crystallin family)